MNSVRKLNAEGLAAFAAWLGAPDADAVPSRILDDASLSTELSGMCVDRAHLFDSRFDFGKYLAGQLTSDKSTLLQPESDGMWAWINAVYFKQLAEKKVRRSEHYIPIRKGLRGSLLHRNAARNAYELFVTHGENSYFCLKQPMHTHGQLLESISASQSIVRNKGFFSAASMLYLAPDKSLKRGFASKPKDARDRKPGDSSGKGSVRRLPTAFKRLDLTYDVEMIDPSELIRMLPPEFSRWF
jgi:hypothetical protein